jgi:hypothetical protein
MAYPTRPKSAERNVLSGSSTAILLRKYAEGAYIFEALSRANSTRSDETAERREGERERERDREKESREEQAAVSRSACAVRAQ